MKLDSYNAIVTTVFTVIATIATIRSCQIARDVQNDERQLHAIDSLVINQQNQINTQRSELNEITIQTDVLRNEVLELRSVDTTLSYQTKKISKQLLLNEEQQRVQIKISLLTRKANIVRLRVANRSFEQLLMEGDYRDSKDVLQQLEFLNKIKNILEQDMQNPIILDDDSLSLKWIDLYSTASNTQYSLNTQPGHFSITKKINGREIIDTSDEALVKNKQDDYDRFIDGFNRFYFYFLKFMQRKNKEINLNFE